MGKKDALSATDWIEAGFRALVTEGGQGIRAEALARALKISKGSFYWHFVDLAAFKRAMIDFWYEHATASAIEQFRAEAQPGIDRLRLVIGFASMPRIAFGGRGVENAIREWARSDSYVRDVAKRAEHQRLAFLAECFADAGFDDGEARWRAENLYACLIGLESLHGLGVDVGENLEQQLTLLMKPDLERVSF